MRLYVKGVVLGYKRGLRNQTNHTSLVKIAGVEQKTDVDFYLGKRIAYIYKVRACLFLWWATSTLNDATMAPPR